MQLQALWHNCTLLGLNECVKIPFEISIDKSLQQLFIPSEMPKILIFLNQHYSDC
jgi:hypothetical protein